MKKTYQIPSVEMALLKPCSIICVSPAGIGAGTGSGTTGDIGGGSSPIPGE